LQREVRQGVKGERVSWKESGWAGVLLKNKTMSGREWIGILILSMYTDVSYIYTNSAYTATSRPQDSQPLPPPCLDPPSC